LTEWLYGADSAVGHVCVVVDQTIGMEVDCLVMKTSGEGIRSLPAACVGEVYMAGHFFADRLYCGSGLYFGSGSIMCPVIKDGP